MELKRIKSLSTSELEKIFGGDDPIAECDPRNCPPCMSGADAVDCTSETVSGGTTTDSE